ncbi:hypothetical protein Pst134EA_015419 [Puccinia striiformis f. sp. tritici]|uniref:hypothetical protein n=1 Tax=Puccinia striiformis f. sp. tritici TaxID=168172 RepID=UPI0020078D6A|nr:hypothetical protein Pst134EA_015419 [Puccinia striiformis f. sp. tritici]KAH9463334.1 hypothetical protein Pst134EA_015419 [Puccinia striiformis f. sp. tritici]
MQFLSVSAIVSLLVVSVFAEQVVTQSKLERRYRKDPPLPITYIMQDGLNYSTGPLKIWNPDGSIAYLFDKGMRDYAEGISWTFLMNPLYQTVLRLDSVDDICGTTNQSGEIFHVVFERNYSNKSGIVYTQGKGKTRILVAELREEVRHELWLSTKSKGVKAYILSCTADAPQAELLALMGLVNTRVHDCGL